MKAKQRCRAEGRINLSVPPTPSKIPRNTVARTFHARIVQNKEEHCPGPMHISLLPGRKVHAHTRLARGGQRAGCACVYPAESRYSQSHGPVHIRAIVGRASRRNGDEISVEPEDKRRAGISSAGRPWWERDEESGERSEETRMNGDRSLTHRFTEALVTQFTANSPPICSILTAALLTH